MIETQDPVIVYACHFCREIDPGARWFSVDCENHEYSHHSPFFFDAIGTAMLHQRAAIR